MMGLQMNAGSPQNGFDAKPKPSFLQVLIQCLQLYTFSHMHIYIYVRLGTDPTDHTVTGIAI